MLFVPRETWGNLPDPAAASRSDFSRLRYARRSRRIGWTEESGGIGMKGKSSLKKQAMTTVYSGALVRFLGFALRLWLSAAWERKRWA